MSNLIIGKIVIFLLLIFTIFLYIDLTKGQTKIYDCGMAEWHPDIPWQVKEECRKLRIEELKRQQEVDKATIYRT